MPEGNEVHRWAARHTAAFGGRKLNVLPGPNHRFSDAHLVDGKKLLKVHAVGKHLGYEFPGELYLHVHLGRFGDFTEGCGPLPEPKGALRGILQRAMNFLPKIAGLWLVRSSQFCSTFSAYSSTEDASHLVSPVLTSKT